MKGFAPCGPTHTSLPSHSPPPPLFSYGPYAYSLGKGLPHLMNVTRYHPYSTEEDLALRTGPSTKAIRQLWDGYSAWLPGQRTALAEWKEV